MSGKLTFIAVLLCFNQLAFGADLAKEKQNALNKMEIYWDSVSKATKDMNHFFLNREVYLSTIKAQKVELGQSIRELNIFEINQMAEASKQRANVLSYPQSVLDCIEAKKAKTLSQVEETFTKKFAQPVEDLREKAKDSEHRLTAKWCDQNDLDFEVFDTQFARTTEAIKSTNSITYVQGAFNHFEKVANKTIAHILSLPDIYAKHDIHFDRVLEHGPMAIIRTSARKTVDDFTEAVNNCFHLV